MKLKLLFLLGLSYFFAVSVVLAGVPAEVTYRGVLREYGQLVTGKRKLCFNLYNTETGGQILWTSGHIIDVDVINGMFSCELAPAVDLRTKELWLEVYVSDKKLSGREKLTSSFFALHSGSAENITSTGTITITVGSNSIATISQSEGIKSFINNTTYYMVPRGAIIMWSGTIETIPSGWALCNGTDGTPDLRGSFVIGAGGAYNPLTAGGSATHFHNQPSHNHTLAHTHSISVVDHSHTINISHNHGYSTTTGGPNESSHADGNGTYGILTSATHTHALSGTTGDSSVSNVATSNSSPGGSTGNPSVGNTGNANPNTDNTTILPPYFALAYIMKL